MPLVTPPVKVTDNDIRCRIECCQMTLKDVAGKTKRNIQVNDSNEHATLVARIDGTGCNFQLYLDSLHSTRSYNLLNSLDRGNITMPNSELLRLINKVIAKASVN